MIQLQNISLGYDTKRLLLDNVSATFTCGTTTALIGRNGTGKSTLLRAIIGSESLKQGTILINGTDIQLIAPLSVHIACPSVKLQTRTGKSPPQIS